MSGVQERKEGSYASLEKTPLPKFINHDLGLTLLPRSQSWRKDERRSGTAAKSSPKQSGSKYVKTSERWNSSDIEIQSNCSAQETAFPTKAKNPSSSPDPGPDSARFSHVTSRINGERPVSRKSSAKSSSGVVGYSVSPLATAPCVEQVEQIKVTSEVENANSRQNDGCSPRATKRRKIGSRASNQTEDLKVSKESEAALENHFKRSHMYPDQSLSEVHVVRSGRRSISIETIRDHDRGTGKGLGSSKPESCRRITHGLGTAPARFHQETNVGSEVTALQRISSVLAALASKSPAKDQHLEPEKLIEHYQPSFSSQSFSTQYGKHSRLLSESPAGIGTQVLKEVNRSSTRPFPKKAKKTHGASRPASSLASFTSGQHLYHTNTLLTSHANTYISNAHLSHSLPIAPHLSKDFNHPSNVPALEDIFQTARATNQPHLLRRRSASVPNLSSTSARPDMDFSNNLGPASMPTPPREKPKSLEVSNPQQMNGAPLPKAGVMAAGGQPSGRPYLDIKANYSLEEVKYLASNLNGQAQILKAENTSLQSTSAAMKKGFESLQHEKADLLEQIQHHERTSAHKDQLIKKLRLQGSQLLQQYKLIWDEHHQLLANLRREDGTGNPSAIAQTIRRNHSPSALTQRNQSSAKASLLYRVNGTQLSVPGHAVEQTSTIFHENIQPTFIPGSSEVNVTNASSKSLHPAKFAITNHDDTKISQPISVPVYQEANVANASLEPRFAAANHNQTHSPHHGSTEWVPANQQLSVTDRTVTSSDQIDSRPIQQVPTERVTIDLTDDSQSPSSSASPDAWVHQTRHSSVQGGYPPFNLPPAQYPTGYLAMSQNPTDLSRQGEEGLKAMQMQREIYARMAKKDLSWLRGENPFRKATHLPNLGQPSQSHAEAHVLSAQSPEAGRVAPMPETATRRANKTQAPKKTRVAMDAEARKERQKVYRRTAAEKKKREKELAKQAFQDQDKPSDDMRAQKQDRRAAKGGKRREQARKPSEEACEPQKTLDGRFYQEDTGVQRATYGGSMYQTASDDRDSLFDESEGDVADSSHTDIAMHDAAAAEEEDRAKFAAQIEADFEAEAESGGQDHFPTAVADNDHGFHDFSDQSEESEEE